jgi:predicted secreted Zn-dependent protease
MSDKSTADAMIEAAIAAERQRCIDRVLTYAALRDQAAIDLDKAASGSGPEVPSEGAAERARMQAEVARDVACFLAEQTKA